MNGDFMALPMHLLDGRVIGIFVRDEEGRFDVATVGILTFATENFLVKSNVVVVDGIVECYSDHLGHVFGR